MWLNESQINTAYFNLVWILAYLGTTPFVVIVVAVDIYRCYKLLLSTPSYSFKLNLQLLIVCRFIIATLFNQVDI